MKPQGPFPETDDPALAYARQLTLVVYVLHAVSSVTLITFFVAIFINYSRHDRTRQTIYESHFDWQISTFWYALVYFMLGVGLLIWGAIAWFGKGGGIGIFILGMLVLFVNWCWHLYRVIRGLMHWNDRRPMPG
jgi:uncharacterized membrane protein